MIKNPSGRMVPIKQNMILPTRNINPKNPSKPLQQQKQNLNQIPRALAPIFTPAPFIVALVVKKRNLYLEQISFPNIENYDVYEIIAFYNTEKLGSVGFVNYKPVNTSTWRIITKYIKQVSYNQILDIASCPNTYEEQIQHLVHTPQHLVHTPQHVPHTPEDVVHTPQHAPHTPEDVVETPQDVVETPQDVVETPQDVVETPQDVVETPKDIVETPKDVLESQ